MKSSSFAPSAAWVITYTGRYIDLLNPEPSQIEIDDIAAALAKTNRFNGHARRSYTVAEHCLLGVDQCTPACKLEFLLHDATEAYIGDVVGPLKATPMFAAYRELEARWWDAIALRFGVRAKLPKEIGTVDQRMLVTEMRDLTGRWPVSTDAYKPFPLSISPIASPVELVQEKFLAKFYELVSVTVGAKR
jgi:hypothetical protein